MAAAVAHLRCCPSICVDNKENSERPQSC